MNEITNWLIIGTVVVWLVWDVAILIRKRETISQRIIKWSKHWPAIPFAVGFLIGHWYG